MPMTMRAKDPFPLLCRSVALKPPLAAEAPSVCICFGFAGDPFLTLAHSQRPCFVQAHPLFLLFPPDPTTILIDRQNMFLHMIVNPSIPYTKDDLTRIPAIASKDPLPLNPKDLATKEFHSNHLSAHYYNTMLLSIIAQAPDGLVSLGRDNTPSQPE